MGDRLVLPSQIEDAASDPDRGAWTYEELQARNHPSNVHFHTDEQGTLRRCYHKCQSWVRIALVVLVVDVLCELVTFMPIHRLFEMLGWIS